MGCGASTGRGGCEPKPITEEEMKTMCLDACIRMEVLCIQSAFTKEIKIKPPPELESMNKSIAYLKEQAKKLGDSKVSGGSGGGLMGSVMNAAAGAVNAAASVAGAGLDAAAKTLDGITDKLEEPFQTVAKDVIDKKRADLYNTCVAFINAFKFAEPVQIVRGDAPWSKEQYEAVPGDKISKTMTTLAQNELCKQLLPHVTEAIKEHAVTTGWLKAQNTYNAAFDIITKAISADDLAKAGVKRIELQLPEYITLQIFLALADHMGKIEAATRKDPKDKDVHQPRKPISFAKIFSIEPLYGSDFQFWGAEKA